MTTAPALRHRRSFQSVTALRKHRSVFAAIVPLQGGRRGQRRRRRSGGARRRSAGNGARRRCLRWRGAPTRIRRSSTRFDPKGFRRDVVEFHPAYHDLMRASIAAGLHCLDLDPVRQARRAAGGSRARGALLHGGADRERALVPDHHDARGAGAARRCAGAARQKSRRKLPPRSYDPAFRPWWEKSGMTLGMGMTEKQGGTDVRANSTTATPSGEALYHHRSQMVSVRADVRRLFGAGAGARRTDVFFRAALSARRLGQRASSAAAEGQARQPLQCVERGRIRRCVCLARRRRRRRRAHHHPDGAVDAA